MWGTLVKPWSYLDFLIYSTFVIKKICKRNNLVLHGANLHDCYSWIYNILKYVYEYKYFINQICG